MDDIVLVDNMEVDGSINADTSLDLDRVLKPRNGTGNGNAEVHLGRRTQLNQLAPPAGSSPAGSSSAKRGSVSLAISMYSPDIPACSVGGRFESRPSIANYYTLIETEETVKCILSTTLFFVVLVAFVLITVLMNPEM